MLLLLTQEVITHIHTIEVMNLITIHAGGSIVGIGSNSEIVFILYLEEDDMRLFLLCALIGFTLVGCSAGFHIS